MNKPCWVAVLLCTVAATVCFGQDSVDRHRNSLEVSLRHEHYPQGNDRTYAYVQYGRSVRTADIFAKVVRYSVGENVGYLFETDAYIRHRKKRYSYFNAGWSASEMLPNFRLRAELFQNWKRFEFSAGTGVIKPHHFEPIPLMTGTIGYYFGDYFVYARPTFSHVDDAFSKSIFVQARRYLNRTDFIALSALRGADTGTERNINAIANSFGLDTFLARLNGQFRTGHYKIGVGFDYGGIFIPVRDNYMRFAGFDVFINRAF